MAILSVKKRLLKKKKILYYFKKKELDLILCKYLINCLNLNFKEKAFLSFNLFSYNYYISELYLFCFISGRGKSVYKKYNLSRIVLKEIQFMYYLGLRKLTW
jgi:ribosomal protein S14